MLLMPLAIMAQAPSVKVVAKRQVTVGEQFKVSFEINDEGKKFTPPSFKGFTVVGGPFNSMSTSIQSVNGSSTHTVTSTYSYVLRADSEGEFTIGPASVTIGGTVVKSEPFTVTVSADASGSGTTSNGTKTQGGQSKQNTKDPNASGKDLFLKVIPSKRTPYVGEPVVLTYKLYTRVDVLQVAASKTPSYGGFWVKECSDNSSTLLQSSETLNGIEYTTAVVKRVVVIPQKSGKLTIDPMGLECQARVVTQRTPQDYNDPFGGFYDPFGMFNDPMFLNSYSYVNKVIEAPALTLEVKPLPEDGKPDSFAGAVGDYTFSADIDASEVKTNETMTMTVTVKGNGNLELLDMPSPVFPPDFEVYPPEMTSNVEASSQGMKGTRKAEYLVIPRHAGDFNIPPVEFSYFNPSKQQYVTLTSSPLDIKVNKGADGDDGGVYVHNQEDIKILGNDIRHIKTSAVKLRPVGQRFFASLYYFIFLSALLVVFLVTLFLVKKRRQFRQDVALVRNKKATSVARSRLKKARKYLDDRDQTHFYEELSQALWGYISDKLGIERSVLSMDSAKEAMMGKGIDEALANEFIETLNACEFARFAPGDATSKMEELYKKGMDVVMKVEGRVRS